MARTFAQRLRSLTIATSMATRLPSAVLVVSLISLIVATFVGVRTGTDLGRELTDERLIAMRSAARLDLERELTSLGRTATSLAASEQAVVALDSFGSAYDELSALEVDELGDEIEAVAAAYRERYIEPLEAVGRDLNLRDVIGESTAALYLHYHYAVDLGVVEDPAAIDDPGDGSTWSSVHDVFHPVYRDVVDRLDLYDLLFIEPEQGIVVYSSEKRADFGTSLDLGPFSGSFVAALFDRIRDDPEAGAIVSDLSFYNPALLSPIGAIGAPVMDDGELAGVVVLTYEASRLTSGLTADGDWERGGFPPTGVSFLVGADGTLRTDPRTYLEDPDAHLEASIAAGELTEADVSFIEAAGTVVLTQEANDETVDAAEGGDREVRSRTTMTGGEAFSTAVAVGIEGPEWYVVSEIDAEVADGDLDDFVDLLVVGTAIFIVSLAFLAVAWAARIVRPIRAISDRLGRKRADLGPIEIPTRSPIEFRRLANSFESMSEILADQQQQLAVARDERLRLLRRMLPPQVAERVASGDLESIEEVPQATVAVVVVLGLSEMVRQVASESDRELIEALHGELDQLAEQHGVERIRIVGDSYYASCGHARPYIDHAPRVIAFAAEARDAVREAGSELPHGLAVAIGVHTGPVTVGVTAATRLLYDVWGEPVTVAHHLARRADPNTILATEATKALLPDSTPISLGWSDDAGSVWVVDSEMIGGRA